MFIIERRTAGVFAALATIAALVVLGNIRDRVDEVETSTTATSTPAFASSVGPGVRPIALGETRHEPGRRYQKFLGPD